MSNTRPKTIFCDIDGTIIKHSGSLSKITAIKQVTILDGVIETFDNWDKLGYNIVLTTGRRENLRSVTEQQLNSIGISYDMLIMGLGGGDRVLINDKKPDAPDRDTCYAINLKRDSGFTNVHI